MKKEIERLKEICQGEKKNQESWYLIHRNLSILATYFLIKTKITPNAVSWLMIVFTLISIFFLVSESYLFNLLGVFFLYCSFLLDKVDGEIARYKKIESINGVWIDWLYHRVFIIVVYGCIMLPEIYGLDMVWIIAANISLLLAIFIEDNQLFSYRIYSQKLYKKKYLFEDVKEIKWNRKIKLFRMFKIFRLNITLIYMLPLVFLSLKYEELLSLKSFIFLSLLFNSFYFIIQSYYYYRGARKEDLSEIEKIIHG